MLANQRTIDRGLAAVLGALLWWLPVHAGAQNLATEERDVSGFHGLHITGSGRIELSRGAREGLTIDAPAETLEKIVTEVNGGILKISKQRGSWNLRGPIRMTLTYVTLDQLDLTGSADVRTDWITGESFRIGIRGSSDVDVAGFELDELDVTVSGSGDLDVRQMSAQALTVNVSGSGDVTLRGTSSQASVTVRGSGNVDLRELEVQEAETMVSGSGNVDLWVVEHLDASISGSGDITVRGEPEVESRISGSGRLRSR